MWENCRTLRLANEIVVCLYDISWYHNDQICEENFKYVLSRILNFHATNFCGLFCCAWSYLGCWFTKNFSHHNSTQISISSYKHEVVLHLQTVFNSWVLKTFLRCDDFINLIILIIRYRDHKRKFCRFILAVCRQN
jgi:hypothetical protein